MSSVYKRREDRNQKGTKWRVSWFDAEQRVWRDKVGYADKEATAELGRRLERESARRAVGLADLMDEHRNRSIQEHLEAFLDKVRASDRSPRYLLQLENRIHRIIEEADVDRLHELDPVVVAKVVRGLRIKKRPLSGITRNEYLGSIKAFTKWAVAAGRIDRDPLASLSRIERNAIKPVHPRRALSPEDLSRLLQIVVDRPLREAQTIRRGDAKGQLKAKVRPAVAKRLRLLGKHRRLAYLLAIWAGLRRSELQALVWGDIDLDIMPPKIRLRAETTKSKRADCILLHPQLADELRMMQPSPSDRQGPVLLRVPGMKAWKNDLKAAGIEYGDQAIGYADLHAQRKTLSTMLAAHGMSQRLRQAHLRHTDPRLTDNTYMDERLLPVADALAKVPPIPEHVQAEPQTLTMRATGTHGAEDSAGNMQETCGPKRLPVTSADILDNRDAHARSVIAENSGSSQVLDLSGVGIKKNASTPHGIEAFEKAGDGIRTHDIHVGKA
jgi:integrase